jgi:hypothetical protein
MDRDEYQFEMIIRGMLRYNKSKKIMEVLESVSILQPILNSIMQKIIKANSVND